MEKPLVFARKTAVYFFGQKGAFPGLKGAIQGIKEGKIEREFFDELNAYACKLLILCLLDGEFNFGKCCWRGRGVGICAFLAGNGRFWLPILLPRLREEGGDTHNSFCGRRGQFSANSGGRAEILRD